MLRSNQFRKEKFSEPVPRRSKPGQWRPTEDKVLWKSESRKLLDTVSRFKVQGFKKNKFNLVRNCFMIELGLYTGLRVMEMSKLKVRDLIIHDKHSSIVVREGKGGKRRDVWINSIFKAICQEFLESRKHFGLPNTSDSFLLVSGAGLPLTTRALEKAFKKCAAAARLHESYSIHCLRHTYATFSLEAGVDIRFLKEQMGHSTIKTTEMYLSLLQDKNRRALEGLYKGKRGSRNMTE